MKLRICICLFSILAVLNLSLLYLGWGVCRDYQNLKQAYHQLVMEKSKKETPENIQEAQSERFAPSVDMFYYVTLEADEIVAYSGDHKQIHMRLPFEAGDLTEVFLNELQQGIYVENLPALYEYLENSSS